VGRPRKQRSAGSTRVRDEQSNERPGPLPTAWRERFRIRRAVYGHAQGMLTADLLLGVAQETDRSRQARPRSTALIAKAFNPLDAHLEFGYRRLPCRPAPSTTRTADRVDVPRYLSESCGDHSPLGRSPVNPQLLPAQLRHDAPALDRFHARMLVGAAGFEPTTTSPPDWCATRLRHAPTRARV
jgi:hypothetical protein